MRDWIDFAFMMLKALSVSGMVMVLNHHIPLDWWEGALLGFGVIMLFGERG